MSALQTPEGAVGAATIRQSRLELIHHADAHT